MVARTAARLRILPPSPERTVDLSVPALLKRAQSAGTTLLCLAACTACAPPAPADIMVTHVNIVDVERGLLLADRTIAVRAGRIERIDSGGPAKRRARVVLDGTSRYVLPGLWDMHVHVGDDERTLGRLLGWGIVGVRDMGSDLDEMLAVRARQLAQPHLGPRVFFGGPALRGARDSADTGLAVVRSPEDGRRTVALLAGQDVDFIKVHEGLTGDAWYAIAAAARARGLPLTGHVPAGLGPEQLADSGLRSIEHLEFLADRCLVLFDSAQQAGDAAPPPGCGPSQVAAGLAHLHQDRVWLDPTIGSFRVFAPRQWPAILTGFSRLLPQIRRVGLRMLAGTDLGSAGIVPGESLHDELALLVRAGIPAAEALRGATVYPAEFLAIGDSLGAVRAGYAADLLILDGNPLVDIRNTRRVAAVIRAGVLRDSLALAGLRGQP